MMPDFETIEDAAAARNRAWFRRMRGEITQAELFEVLRAVRREYRQAIYDKELR